MTQSKNGRSGGLTRRDFGKGVAAVAAGTLAAPAIAAAEPVLKVGVLLPKTGYLAQAGQACQRGADVAPAVLADMGIKVELLNADTESNANVARARTESMIQDGANVIVGAFESGQTLAAAQVCEQKGIPLVINIAAAPQITEQGYQTVFRNFPTSEDFVRNGLALMKDLFKETGAMPQTAVFLHANDTFGQANRAAMDKLFPTLDMPFKLVESISYDPKAQDLSVEVAKVKASGAQLALVTTRANDAILMVREMVKQRYEPMGIISPGSPGMYDEQFYKTLGKYSDYCISNVPWYNPRSEVSKRVEAAFKKSFPNDRFEGYAFNVGFTFEALLVAADAFKRAGTADPQALLAALRRTDLEERMMIGGPIRFDVKGQNNGIGAGAIQNRNLTPVVVLPKDVAQMEPIFPMPGWTKRS
jgi:branched-chain amino acid transport system substrate-binding protein